jgi:metallo-beta-lactamase class B
LIVSIGTESRRTGAPPLPLAHGLSRRIRKKKSLLSRFALIACRDKSPRRSWMRSVISRSSFHARWSRALRITLALTIAFSTAVCAQTSEQLQALNKPVPPFHIIGNIYYVGASDLTSFLIVTPAGDILLDGGLADTAPQIEANIQALGFKLSDVKLLLNSHAHLDHAGGLAELQAKTGARLVAMEGDAETISNGDNGSFPPAKPNRIMHDGDTVSVGGVTLTAHLTPGHTRGCTTWTMLVKEGGRSYHVVFVGSASVLPNYRLIDRPSAPATYRGIQADYEETFRVLHSLPCDVFLAAHGSFFSLTEKRKAMAANPAQNPFVDSAGYRAYVERAEKAYRTDLQRQRAAQQD